MSRLFAIALGKSLYTFNCKWIIFIIVFVTKFILKWYPIQWNTTATSAARSTWFPAQFFTSGKKYHRCCSDWNRYFQSLMLRVNSVYQCPVSYITNRSLNEQHIKAPSSPSPVSWQKRLKSASKPHSLHSLRQDVWYCRVCPLYGVVGPANTLSSSRWCPPCLIVCIDYSTV